MATTAGASGTLRRHGGRFWGIPRYFARIAEISSEGPRNIPPNGTEPSAED